MWSYTDGNIDGSSDDNAVFVSRDQEYLLEQQESLFRFFAGTYIQKHQEFTESTLREVYFIYKLFCYVFIYVLIAFIIWS